MFASVQREKEGWREKTAMRAERKNNKDVRDIFILETCMDAPLVLFLFFENFGSTSFEHAVS